MIKQLNDPRRQNVTTSRAGENKTKPSYIHKIAPENVNPRDLWEQNKKVIKNRKESWAKIWEQIQQENVLKRTVVEYCGI